jgi:hypothetical protein
MIASVDGLIPYNMEWRRIRKGVILDDRCISVDHGAESRSGSIERDHDSGRHLDEDGSGIYVGVM